MDKKDEPGVISATMQERIRRNRERAIQLRKARLAEKPYSNRKNDKSKNDAAKEIDTGAGFFLEVTDENTFDNSNIRLAEEPDPVMEMVICKLCKKKFGFSYLYNNFWYKVCDNCRDNDGDHSLITRTEAKQQYLLKDCDLDMREPPLKCITRKNPHNPRWGQMKLYLLAQVKDRSYEIWKDEEGLNDELVKRASNQELYKQKKFNKRINELRKVVRSSTWKKDLSKHEHQFGEDQEVFDKENSVWVKTCTECNYKVSFEKM